MEIANILKDRVFDVLSENSDITLPYIIELVNASLDENVHVYNLPKAIRAILALGCRRGSIQLNRFGRYSLPNNEQENLQEPICNVLKTIQSNCHIKSRKRSVHNLDPNVRKRVYSNDSISGDELEVRRKMLRTNNKRMKVHKMPTKLPQAHTYEQNNMSEKKFVEVVKTKSNKCFCFISDEIQPYDTLTVINPESKKKCGVLLYLPPLPPAKTNQGQSVNLQSDQVEIPETFCRPATEPPTLAAHNQHLNDNISNAQMNLNTLNSDELKAPGFVSSHGNLDANARKNAKRRAARAALKARKLNKSIEDCE